MTEIRKSSIALLLFITACSNTPNVPTDVTKPDTDTKDKKETTINQNGPTDFQGIADILGCMFAPHTCESN
jgi:PBP1b-binding outer membrane lipoprotein LpoB|tara:strand:+ start:468 stop:680 length:213 start_codon:yes stop_codon:yes gene_type:complete